MLSIFRTLRQSAEDRGLPPVWGPLLVLLAGTAAFRLTHVDLLLSQLFYAGGSAPWPLVERQPWLAIYALGVYPGFLVGLGGLMAWGLGGWSVRWARWRVPGAYCFLLLLIGPGLLVNLTLKDNWGRPRPNQIVDFGGQCQFLRVGDADWDAEGRSFPSGHAAMGFYLMAPGFLLYRHRRRAARLYFWIGLGCGLVMGTTRVVQGRHFASDVLWSAGIVYFAGLALLILFDSLGRGRPAQVAEGTLELAR